MKQLALILLCAVAAAGCKSGPESFGSTVMSDFGLKEKPEGYVSASDQVYKQLDVVGQTEMKRLNLAERNGVVKFQGEGLHGQYYKEVKVYEEYHPIDAAAMSMNSQQFSRGFNGYIDYTYRIYQSERRDSKAEAEALTANIPTGDEGHESYRYKFNDAGIWDGARGEKAKK